MTESIPPEGLPAEGLPADVIDALANDFADVLGPERVHIQAALGELTTYRVGGNASLLVEVDSGDELAALQERTAAVAPDIPIAVVGLGSNLLVADSGFDGLVVVLGEGLAEIEIEGTTVRAGGRAKLPVVARTSGAAGLTGFEWAVGVPGSIGGAVRMNAGGHGADMSASLVEAAVYNLVDGSTRVVGPDELALQYRSSNVAPHEVVLSVVLQLAPGDVSTSKSQMSDIVRWRLEHQPGGQNAGSVFTNPDGDSAGRLIDAAGLKGFRVGTAVVSSKHANFIQADPGGRAADVLALMSHIVREVESYAGVALHPETRLLGFSTAAE